MSYIDGFVIAVPTANRQAFIDHATMADAVFLEMGAIRVLECWGEDVKAGKRTDFRRAVDATDEESVVFSWIEWPDKATRDRAMARMMDGSDPDPRLDPDRNPMPFDGARMIYGGFEPVVTLEAAATNRPGDHIWYELMTSDADGAQAFYADVLGWTFADSGMAGMDYRFFHAGDHGIGGLMPITADMAAAGALPAWLGYVLVEDVDAAVARAQTLGGTVRMAAMDIDGVGRMALIADPSGAPFYVMTPLDRTKSLSFADDRPRTGHCAWNELQVPDPAAAWGFYGALFGWTKDGAMSMGDLGAYEFIRHGTVMGAIMTGRPEWGPARWTRYFRVDDIDGAKAAVERGGGQVVQGPDAIPGDDYAMVCLDPQGAGFGLVGKRIAA